MGLEDRDKITEDYPGFVVHDGRVSGSITLGHTRMPLWAPIKTMVEAGYSTAVEFWPSLPSEGSADAIGDFLYDLLEQRKEFGRLLCVLADVERQERLPQEATSQKPWYASERCVARVRRALTDSLRHLEEIASANYEYVVENDPEELSRPSLGEVNERLTGSPITTET